MGRPEDRVLSYYDVLLRRCDTDLLRGPHWLNDQIISFWFEYLAREAFPRLSASTALLPPPAAFLLVHTDPSAAGELLAPLDLRSKQLVLLPVNDNPDAETAGGGTHWSLLAFHRPSNRFLHFDSAPGAAGEAAARQLAGAAAPLVRDRSSGGGGSGGSSGGGVAKLPTFEQCPHAPRQSNGHDCGVYALAVAQQLLAWQSEDPDGLTARLPELPRRVTPGDAAALRREVLATVERLAAQEAAAGQQRQGTGG